MLVSDEPVLDDLSLQVWRFLNDTVKRSNGGSFDGLEVRTPRQLVISFTA